MIVTIAAPLEERVSRGDATTIVLWTSIALFFVRVVGQVEVLLVEPAWLPPMSAWYSGLLPYPVLLPLQIGLLMLMCVLVTRRPSTGASTSRPRRALILRALAILYFAVMVVRLIWCVNRYGSDFYLHGAIPIAFHWALALFVLCYARRQETAIHRRLPARRSVSPAATRSAT